MTSGPWMQDASGTRRPKKIHLLSLLGHWEEVLEALALGVDPNARTPAQGAPPIFYASCWDKLGPAHVGRGDEGRLRVLELFASNPNVDLSLEGRAMWAHGRTIMDLVSMGRCPVEAVDVLVRGREAMVSYLSQEGLHCKSQRAMYFSE